VTVGVVGVPLFYLVQTCPTWHRVLATAAFTALSIWIHQAGDAILAEKDSRKLVWDELAGYFVAIAVLPFSWPIAVAAFVIERSFDIVKVPPARWIERTWPGGLGVVGDDVVAGLYTCAILHAAVRWAPHWLAAGG
jgi:phosphatidylglycerophosphatase A